MEKILQKDCDGQPSFMVDEKVLKFAKFAWGQSVSPEELDEMTEDEIKIKKHWFYLGYTKAYNAYNEYVQKVMRFTNMGIIL